MNAAFLIVLLATIALLGGQQSLASYTSKDPWRLTNDPMGRLVSAQPHYVPSGASYPHELVQWTYDGADNVATRSRGGLTGTFNTDARNRLTSITRSGTISVAGIATNEAVSVTVNGQPATLDFKRFFAPGVTLNDGPNTFTAIGEDAWGRKATNIVTANYPATITFNHDGNGNLLYDGTRAYKYDAENRLTNVLATNLWRTDFRYDDRPHFPWVSVPGSEGGRCAVISPGGGFMRRNVGGWDRRIRWAVGAGALATAVMARRRSPALRIGALLAAGTEFVTAATRYCPVNQALGIDTTRQRQPKGIALDEEAVTKGTRFDRVHELTDELAYQRLALVNVVFWGTPSHWVLIDAGVPGSAGAIRKAAEARFGAGAKPTAIILTHGHFDHVGALNELGKAWDVAIYAHEMEAPYLDGRSSYPPPDPSVGGGLMARMSSLYPRGPIDVSRWLRPLPKGGTVPGMEGWTWIPTPGHTPGHVSLWNAAERILIAGDAIITTRQESAYAVATQRAELNGPPKYYTQDWSQAEESVRRIAALEPQLVLTGHGPAMTGPKALRALHRLADDFRRLAVPEDGRYVREPAIA